MNKIHRYFGIARLDTLVEVINYSDIQTVELVKQKDRIIDEMTQHKDPIEQPMDTTKQVSLIICIDCQHGYHDIPFHLPQVICDCPCHGDAPHDGLLGGVPKEDNS